MISDTGVKHNAWFGLGWKNTVRTIFYLCIGALIGFVIVVSITSYVFYHSHEGF